MKCCQLSNPEDCEEDINLRFGCLLIRARISNMSFVPLIYSSTSRLKDLHDMVLFVGYKYQWVLIHLIL